MYAIQWYERWGQDSNTATRRSQCCTVYRDHNPSIVIACTSYTFPTMSIIIYNCGCIKSTAILNQLKPVKTCT